MKYVPRATSRAKRRACSKQFRWLNAQAVHDHALREAPVYINHVCDTLGCCNLTTKYFASLRKLIKTVRARKHNYT